MHRLLKQFVSRTHHQHPPNNNWWAVLVVALPAVVTAWTYFDEESLLPLSSIKTTSAEEKKSNNQESSSSTTTTWTVPDISKNFLNSFMTKKEDGDTRDNQSDDDNTKDEETASAGSFLERIMYSSFGSNDRKENNSPKTTTSKEEEEEESPLLISGKTLGSLVAQLLTSKSDEEVTRALVQKVQENVLLKGSKNSHSNNDSNYFSHYEDRTNFLEIMKALNMAATDTNTNTLFLSKLGDDLLQKLDPISLFYFIEKEDERKNPSWKRRVHRYQSSVDVTMVNDLNDAVQLSELSYADSVQDIQSALERKGMELIYCDVDSLPGKPSHYLALPRGQSFWSPSLDVVMVVRGTKTITDIFTDVMMETENYRGGKAHAGILQSGKYLVKKHTPLLEELCTMSRKRYINLTLIGHSLGAGAASIAGIEWNNDDYDNHRSRFVQAKVVGFGCPALLSKELSESTTDYITTVIDDSDVVPRMSGATITNLLLDIDQHDYSPQCQRDVIHLMEEMNFPETGIVRIQDMFEQTNKEKSKVKANSNETKNDDDDDESIEATTVLERVEPVLFPPGKCVHFFRDGYGIDGSIAPCTFFNEIDVTRRMIDDHYMDAGYRLIFLELMRQYHGDHYFRFDDDNDDDNA